LAKGEKRQAETKKKFIVVKHYDYIIAGAGCGGLSLLTRLVESGKFIDKKILVVDKAPRDSNDHTWCFWEASPGFFEPVVYKQWSQLYFHSVNCSKLLDIHPFRYKMIRAIDFYQYCFKRIAKQQIDIEYGEITSISSTTNRAHLSFAGKIVSADYIFSSIMPDILIKQPFKHYLLQHFTGWLIETKQSCFNATAATLMDFRVPQHHGACFVYILPVSANLAMLECTFFSKEVLLPSVYEDIIRQYLSVYLPGITYRIAEEERGVIPMTNHYFKKYEKRIIYLGNAGGNTKPSSGYAFQFIQSHSEKLTAQLIASGHPYLKERNATRFLFYDTVLLRVLSDGKIPAERVFEKLFCRNSTQKILKFLNNDTTYQEELKIIASLPKLPFFNAAMSELHAALLGNLSKT
jgi:lycopene beta-cyclase